MQKIEVKYATCACGTKWRWPDWMKKPVTKKQSCPQCVALRDASSQRNAGAPKSTVPDT